MAHSWGSSAAPSCSWTRWPEASRCFFGLRTAGPIALGALGVSRWRFVLLNMLSAALWAVASCLLGDQFGNALQWLRVDLRSVEEGMFAAAVVTAAVWAVWRRLRRA
ncbi:MAG: hypothetical protein MUF08_08025 [Burkholderiaceae bacterium]|nr:hypothetical protein [Burkholderiaceae bacterium]